MGNQWFVGCVKLNRLQGKGKISSGSKSGC